MDSSLMPNSRDELLSGSIHLVDDIDIEHDSVPSSGTETPRHNMPMRKKHVDWSIPEEQEEELRSELHRVLTDANGPSSPHNGTISPHVISRPKSVLRKGDVTPTPNCPRDINEGVENLEDKTSAANDAHERASRMAKTSPLSTPVTSSPSRRRRQKNPLGPKSLFHTSNELESGYVTPEEDCEDYIPKPTQWRTGGLAALNLASRWRERRSQSRRGSLEDSHSSNPNTPKGRSPMPSRRNSTASLADLVASSAALGFLGGDATQDIARACRPHLSRSGSVDYSSNTSDLGNSHSTFSRRSSSAVLDTLGKLGSSLKPNSDSTQVRIEKHLQDVKLRQRYLVKLSRALVQFGAPSHRLEEHMKMSARVLEIEAQFLYIPGCMLISFDDSNTHTSEVKLVRADQGIDLDKLVDTHQVYKEVVHDYIGVEEASIQLDDIINREQSIHPWLRVLYFGLASAAVGPFAFQARQIDIPLCFVLGSILGFCQVFLSQQSDVIRHVWELLVVIATSFLARFFGSLQGGNLFCFSALAQSSITMILPGYIMLSGALELSARSLIAGSVRIVWAIIYALYLGFGITIGTALYGLLNSDASSRTTCHGSIPYPWKFMAVPVFALSAAKINFAKWRQIPIMLFIAFSGFVVSYYSAARFLGNSQISSAFGSLTVSVLANTYTRFRPPLQENGAKAWERIKMSWNQIHGICSKMSRWPGSSAIDLEKQSNEQLNDMKKGSLTNRLWRRLTKRNKQRYVSSSESEDANNPEDSRPPSYPLAASIMLPAIFVLVPSGLSVAGSLVQGLETANQITHNYPGSTVSASDVANQRQVASNISFTVSYSIVQIAIGMGVGLFIGNMIVYPCGKGGKRSANMRSALFSF